MQAHLGCGLRTLPEVDPSFWKKKKKTLQEYLTRGGASLTDAQCFSFCCFPHRCMVVQYLPHIPAACYLGPQKKPHR